MNTILLYSVIPALLLASLNSWYWYTRGYRGGKLFFLGCIGFYAMTLLLLKLFFR